MMKTLMLALMALALPGIALADRIPTYVAMSTWTLGGTGTDAFAFQNTSADRDVTIIKININPISSATVTSGPANFWVLPSTAITHGGTSQVSAGSYNTPNWSAPSFIAVSTGPVKLTFSGKDTAQLPIAIIGVNPDESASPIMGLVNNGLDLPTDEQGILLPRGANRGIVLRQKQYGATDWTAGIVMVRIVYIISR